MGNMPVQHARRLAVILHADVVDSTLLVRRNEVQAHDRIRGAFQRFAESIREHGGVAQGNTDRGPLDGAHRVAQR